MNEPPPKKLPMTSGPRVMTASRPAKRAGNSRSSAITWKRPAVFTGERPGAECRAHAASAFDDRRAGAGSRPQFDAVDAVASSVRLAEHQYVHRAGDQVTSAVPGTLVDPRVVAVLRDHGAQRGEALRKREIGQPQTIVARSGHEPR